MHFADTTVVILSDCCGVGLLEKVTKRGPVEANDHENGEGDVSVMMRILSKLTVSIIKYLVRVLSWSRFKELPRGPRSLPTKLNWKIGQIFGISF